VALDQRRRTGVAAVEEIGVQVPAEGVAHLAVRPVRDPDDLEASGEGIRQALPHQQRRGPEEHHPQRRAAGSVLVPELLHDIRPVADLLDLVEDEEPASASAVGRGLPTDRPLRVDPADVLGIGSVCRREVTRNPDRVHDLARERRLADLAWAGQDLDEATWLVRALEDLDVDRPAIHRRQLHYSLR
jgi:hypothetical protein